jgi:serine/threonine-protein kinase
LLVAEVEFGRYRLIELIGRGGMGEVWRAHDTATNRTVAIKVLPPHLAQDGVFVQRFRREAEAAAQLNNPHIIPIHNYGEIGGRLYVDMRLIEGRDLEEVLAVGPLEPGRAVRIIEQVAKALHAAHKIGLVHRDVKPSNILIDNDDFAYLIDFGIARGADQTGLTGTGGVIGSWPYMSPERLRAGQVDARSDIYALACVLYQCLTGSTPYPGDTFEQQMTAHLMDLPPRVSTTHPGALSNFDTVIATGMAKEPNARFATTVDFAKAARDAVTAPIQRQAPPRTRPDDAVTRRRESSTEPPRRASIQRPWWRRKAAATTALAALALAVIAVSVVVGVVITRKEPAASSPSRVEAPSTSSPSRVEAPSTSSSPSFLTAVELPFAALADPVGVAVDKSGNVYVADFGGQEVLKLPGGSGPQVHLPFTGLKSPDGVAVDTSGSVYVTDPQKNRVLKLPADSAQQIELPFTGMNFPIGVAVDGTGTVYVVDSGNNRVLTLPGGKGPQTVLPFAGLYHPSWLALTADGGVYVADEMHSRVVMLGPGGGPQTGLPFTGLHRPAGLAVDGARNVYVTDGAGTYETTSVNASRVLRLPGGMPPQADVPFSGLNRPLGLAVDNAGSLYLTDNRNGRVLKLPAS